MIEGYYALRKECSQLREREAKFEGRLWEMGDGMMVRKSTDGWELRVYRAQEDRALWVSLIDSDGEHTSYGG